MPCPFLPGGYLRRIAHTRATPVPKTGQRTFLLHLEKEARNSRLGDQRGELKSGISLKISSSGGFMSISGPD